MLKSLLRGSKVSMFHYRVITFIGLLSLMLGSLWWTWKAPVGLPLPASQEISSTQRWEQDLSGTWDRFSSLRQAWAAETQRVNGKMPKYSLTGGGQFQLPSNQSFSVAAKRFRIPGEWSARTMQFVVSGVKGHAVVYLNGVDNVHQLGEFEGSGVQNLLEIPATVFRYGEDNVLLIQLSASTAQKESLFSMTWPRTGEIIGQVRLQAVVETTMTNPQISVAWIGESAEVTVKTQLIHQTLSENGPWLVSGVLSDGSAEVAQQSLMIKPDGNSNQTVALDFKVPRVQRWSKQNPFLYQLRLTVSNSKGDQDDVALPVGFRSIALADGKWQLNQETLAINGSVLSLEREAQLRNAGEVKSYLESELQRGVNLLYFLGSFPDELWLQTADQMGMGIWVEWPVDRVPESRLPDPAVFGELVSEGSRHPSIWAWTVGKGLENGSKTTAYVKGAEELVT
ncbi:MAG: glycosyl hydrolase, partial [Desulfitobacteriaceae bacterium]